MNRSNKFTVIAMILGTIVLLLVTGVIIFQLQNQNAITDMPSQAAVDRCKVTFTIDPLCKVTFRLQPPVTSPTQGPTSSPTATPVPVCGTTCDPTGRAQQCPNNHTCAPSGHPNANKCVLTACISNPSLCSANSCTVLPTATQTQAPTNTPRPTNTPNPTNTPRPTNTPNPTPTPNPSCGSSCDPNSTTTQCPNNHTCAPSGHPNANKCIISACVENPNLCSSNSCTVLPTATVALTSAPTRTPAPGVCSASCSTNSDCANNLICSGGMCRNPDCTEQPNCACYFVPTPEVPVTGTGTTLVGIGVIAGGILLLLLGLAF